MGAKIRHTNAPFWIAMREAERGILERALKAAGGRISIAAKYLGITRQHMGVRCDKLGIKYGRGPKKKPASPAAVRTSSPPAPPEPPEIEPPLDEEDVDLGEDEDGEVEKPDDEDDSEENEEEQVTT